MIQMENKATGDWRTKPSKEQQSNLTHQKESQNGSVTRKGDERERERSLYVLVSVVSLSLLFCFFGLIFCNLSLCVNLCFLADLKTKTKKERQKR